MYLSIIIPAYKAEDEIGPHLMEIDKYLQNKFDDSDSTEEYEIILVIDGCPQRTFEVALKFQNMIKNLKIINREKNMGKGYSVKEGMIKAKGKYRLFTDADGSTHINHLDKFFPAIQNNTEIIIGSRRLNDSEIPKRQPIYKEMIGNIGNLLIRLLGPKGFKDTQAGFKLFTEKAAGIVFPRVLNNRWGFDFEILMIAKKHNVKVTEMPIKWINDESTTVTLFGKNSYFSTLIELVKMRWGLMNGYYD